jgi:PAS domain S-box-containing protein
MLTSLPRRGQPPDWADVNCHAVLEAAPDAMLVVNRAGEVVAANLQAQKLYGYSREHLIGSVVESLIPARLRDRHRQHRENFFANPETQAMQVLEIFAVRSDASELPVDVSLSLLTIASETFGISVIRDATQRARADELKRSETILRESEARERARVKDLEAILEAVPVPVLIAHDADCRQITGNRAACEQLRVAAGRNFSLSAAPGERPAFRHMKDGVEIPADLLPIQQAVATGKPVYGRPMTMLFEDGTQREEVVNVVPLLDDECKPRGAVAASIDMTEQRQTEQALRESEEKLRLLLDSTAEAIYGIDLEQRCTFCNSACVRALGYERIDEVLGKNMHERMHHTRADGSLYPVEECRVHRVTQTGKGVHADDEVLWKANGTSFPAECWSYPQRRGQELVGAVVAFIDITERKRAEAALANVSRKLIEAQEQERVRISRELHDDIGQRLALLAIELQQLCDDSLILPEVRNRMGELQKQTSEIATDIQSLSHELHSAKLQYLGIAAAMSGFCQEFGEQQKVEIQFKASDLPSPLSSDISLCLFRVLQEALHNSAKHSGVRHFEVRLWETSDEIHLTVGDSGAGFDIEAAKQSRGLGLISMEERIKLLDGKLSVESQPKLGTTIHARVPLKWGKDFMRAAG